MAAPALWNRLPCFFFFRTESSLLWFEEALQTFFYGLADGSSGFVRVLKTLEFQKSDFKALKVLEI